MTTRTVSITFPEYISKRPIALSVKIIAENIHELDRHTDNQMNDEFEEIVDELTEILITQKSNEGIMHQIENLPGGMLERLYNPPLDRQRGAHGHSNSRREFNRIFVTSDTITTTFPDNGLFHYNKFFQLALLIESYVMQHTFTAASKDLKITSVLMICKRPFDYRNPDEKYLDTDLRYDIEGLSDDAIVILENIAQTILAGMLEVSSTPLRN